MENDDLEPNITLEETFDADGNLEGYEATYQDAGREYVIEYDENFNYESETVTKLYDDLFTLEESEESFQTAWGLISSDLAVPSIEIVRAFCTLELIENNKSR